MHKFAHTATTARPRIRVYPEHPNGAWTRTGRETPAAALPPLASAALTSTRPVRSREAHWRLLHLQQLLQLEREAERRHLARELHDELGQQLTAIRLGLVPLLQGQAHQAAHGLATLVEQAIASLRRIVSDWGPAALQGCGPTAALRALGRETAHRMGLSVRVRVSGAEGDVPQEVAVALYRIVQESLTNVARHACASHVRVHLRWEPQAVTVVIQDDGIGLPQDALAQHAGFGLRGLRERVDDLGGRLAFDTPRGGGTRITAQLPLAAASPSPVAVLA